jgi:hypothetical protein
MSSYATDADLLSRHPELSAVDSDDRSIALDDAEIWMDTDTWGLFLTQAHALLAAHILTRRGLVAGASTDGPATAKSAGEISASFAVTATDPTTWVSTPYGRALTEIERRTNTERVTG